MDTSSLNHKVLVMIVGPTSIGKSTLMNEAARLDPQFGRVKSFTTRPMRSNDEPDQYFYFSQQELSQSAATDSILTDTVFPTTGYHYGTIKESFRNQFNLLDTMANSVAMYQALPFARTITISLTAPGNAWEHWFRIRYPIIDEEARQRLSEAKLSIKWSLQQPNMVWLLNEMDDVPGTAARLVGLCRGTHTEVHTTSYAEDMLKTIDTLLS